MHPKFSRRTIIKKGIIAGALFPAIGLATREAAAAALPPLDPSDPTAKALGFVNDNGQVDAKKFATFKPAQKCGSCAQFQGKPTDATAACTIFAGKSVPQNGWCQVWAQRG